VALGNGGSGLSVSYVGVSPGTISSNTIANNNGSGVLVGPGSLTFGNHVAINCNSIFANIGLGSDLTPQGTVNCTTPPPGPNDYTQCPVILSAKTSQVSGTACANCTIEIYIATNEGNDLGHGEGKTFLGSATAHGSGNWSLALSAGQVSAGQMLTATATTTSSPLETSEFGVNVVVGS
jgi:hypothetical protein